MDDNLLFSKRITVGSKTTGSAAHRATCCKFLTINELPLLATSPAATEFLLCDMKVSKILLSYLITNQL
jgi:hypothetical protein